MELIAEVSEKLNGDLDRNDLPLDVFEFGEAGMEIESLTAGYGFTEIGAGTFCTSCSTLCASVDCGCGGGKVV